MGLPPAGASAIWRLRLPGFGLACGGLTGLFASIMPVVQFTANLVRQTEAPSCRVDGATVAEALQSVFAAQPHLRSYVLDDQGVVRKHVVLFVDGTAIADRHNLSDSLRPESEVFVVQALSGG